jgi:polysaccharide biosynthesis protein PslH
MALRTPVVATSKGAEGLAVRDGEHLLIADTAPAFADAVARLLREPALRRRLVDNAYRVVQQTYDWRVILPGFLELVERVGHGK